MVTEGDTVGVEGRVHSAIFRFAFICGRFGNRSAAGGGGRRSVDVASGRCVGVSSESVLKVVEFSFICCESTAVTRCFPVLY